MLGFFLLLVSVFSVNLVAASPLSSRQSSVGSSHPILCRLPILQLLFCHVQTPITVNTPLGTAHGIQVSNNVAKFTVKYASAQRWEPAVQATTLTPPYVFFSPYPLSSNPNHSQSQFYRPNSPSMSSASQSCRGQHLHRHRGLSIHHILCPSEQPGHNKRPPHSFVGPWRFLYRRLCIRPCPCRHKLCFKHQHDNRCRPIPSWSGEFLSALLDSTLIVS